MKKIAIFALVLLWLFVLPCSVFARGGGGCIEGGSLILTPTGNVAIEKLKPGDKVISLSNGLPAESEVRALYSVKPYDYFEVVIEGHILRLTEEHPIEISPGIFRMAGFLKAGDEIYTQENGIIRDCVIRSVKRVAATKDAYNLLVLPGGTYFANGVLVHNKGCFLPETSIRKADGSETPISTIKAGDRLMAFTTQGEMVNAIVQNVITHDVNEYCIVRTAKNVVRVTAEHPFYVGNGTFKTLEALKPGDNIFVFDGNGLSAQQIESIEIIKSSTRVYNLQTDKPNTFFANGIAVHNKGGGGCFPAGVLISTPNGQVPIEKIRPGDTVTAVRNNGRIVSAKVLATHRTKDYVINIQAGSQVLKTTAEHPICIGEGRVCAAGELKAGDSILLYCDNKAVQTEIENQLSAMFAEQQEVYNLTVEGPHTFIADGFVVHNKGGGGGFGGGGGSIEDSWAVFVVWGIVIVISIVNKVSSRHAKKGDNLDYIYGRSTIEKKSGKTLKLLEFISKQDQTMLPDVLKKQAETTFLKLQECWEARDYGPMQALMMPDIYRDHCIQIQGMIRNHEINKIAHLKVDCIDLVNVRYTQKENQREFTALITATASDYYVDDRNGKYLRGDAIAEQFQEFWTFQYFNKAWLLREIEQTRESKVLKEDNFFEQFTDTGVRQIYGAEADKEGEAGPWLGKDVGTKEVRIERLLNFLVQTDKMWNRQLMLETTRRVFLEVMAAWESGNEADVPDKELFPEVADHLRETIRHNKEHGITLEFRNLCDRKAELILIQNYAFNSKDEFIVRICAHAQKIVRRNGQVIHQDGDVTPFEQYITMGRLDNQWKLKEILSPASGESALKQENLDQDSSPQQVQWYYQHARAV
ncbi:MAG: polymorphic toxin-type HINT domain-containing protein [Sedimentisphaerales bacterium]|jgi:intein/homing endonuclease/predicted lipid-binding transport protein (Tim44 family)